jgi:hypothetical protein
MLGSPLSASAEALSEAMFVAFPESDIRDNVGIEPRAGAILTGFIVRVG